MASRARTTSGAQAGRLLLAAGVFTLVNNYLPGAGNLNIAVLNSVGIVACVLGGVSLFLPWHRMHVRAPLVLALAAFALIALGNEFGGVSDFSYAVYYVVVFVWVGIGQPPRTSYWLAPVATAAYLLPFLGDTDAPSAAIPSVTVAIPVCVLVGEVLAGQVRRLDASQKQLRDRLDVLERLASTTTGLGSDLDGAAVARRMVDAAVAVLGGTAALFAEVEGDHATITAAVGLPQDLVGRRVLIEGTWLGLAVASERGVVTTPGHMSLHPVQVGRSGVTVACGFPEVVGGLTVLLDREPDEVTTADEDVLRLLGAQGFAALVNAATHGEVVRQRGHEQDVVDVLTDGVLVLDAEGTLISANTAASYLLGRPLADLIGAPAPVQIAPLGQPLTQEVAPGRWVEATAASLRDTGERVVALHDTSRQRALDEAKDLFLATTSHELRTPLTAIKGYVTLLTRRWDDLAEPARREALATVDRQTDALVDLTEHLLMGARAGSQAHTPEPLPYDLREVVGNAVSTYARLSDRHEVVADLAPDLPEALGQPRNTENVLGQLIENAIKYSPGGGEVTITARAQGSLIAVEVADRGVGVPVGREGTLFTPFSQGGPANTREYGGVGLGLYIVRQLVQAQGGTVSAANREGGGAIVRFTVPVSGRP